MKTPLRRAAFSLLLAATISAPTRAAPEDPAMRHFRTANGLLSRGLNELAVEEYETFLAETPEHEKAPVARYGLAVALRRLGRADEAGAALEHIADAEFEFAADANLLLGQIRLGESRFAEAATALRRIVDAHSDHAQWGGAAALLVEALHRAGEYEDAVDASDRAVGRLPDDPMLHRARFFAALSDLALKKPRQAAQRLQALLEQDPALDLERRALLLHAQALHKAGEFDEAIGAYRAALDALDGALAADAASGLAELLRARGDLESAAEALDRLIALSSDESEAFADAQFRRGRVAFDLGTYRRALRSFEQALRAGHEESKSAWWIGRCQLALDDPEGAAETLRAALAENDDGDRSAWIGYDLAVALVRADRLSDALTLLDEWTSEHADHALAPKATALLAQVAHQTGDHTRAVAAAGVALEHEPAPAPDLAYVRAESLFLGGESEAALSAFETFIDDHPDHEQAPAARLRLGLIAHASGDDDRARALLTPLCEREALPASFQSALLVLGDIAVRAGEWGEAEQWLSRYLEDGLDAPSAGDALVKLGVALREQGRALDALRALDRFEAVHSDSPASARASLERGLALVDRGDAQQAERAFAETLEREASGDVASSALAQLASIANARGEHGKAGALYAQAAEASPRSAGSLSLSAAAAALSGGEPESALAILEEIEAGALESVEAFRADALHALALARSARRAEALARIERILPRADELPASLRSALLYEQAWCLREAEKLDAAQQAYEALLAGEPAPSLRQSALLELAQILRDEGALADAARLLEEALAIDSDAKDRTPMAASHALATIRFEQGRYEEAAQRFEELLEDSMLVDLSPSALLLAGEANFALERFDRAAAQLSRLVEEHPSDPSIEAAMLRLGDSLARLQRFGEAERVFERFLDEHSGSDLWFQAQFGLAWARENQSRHREAIEAYRSVVDRHSGPTAARAQFQIGECLFAMKEHEHAVREFLRVDILFAEPIWSAAANYEAGRCLEALDKRAEARDAYQRAIAIAADSEWARLATQRLEALAHRAAASSPAASD